MEKDVVEIKWKKLSELLNERFNQDLDMQGILFLIGLQELGFDYKKYKKDQKVDIIHIAICTLLEPYGYYRFEGKDNEGWPHFEAIEKLPELKSGQQLRLMKEAVITYFENGGVLN